MNDTIFNIDLPKLKDKLTSKQVQKQPMIILPYQIGKDPFILRGLSRKMIIQRYKTELYESENGKHENEFMEVTSGAKRSIYDHKSTQRSSFSSLFSNNKEKGQNQNRHLSINHRKVRLPKLMIPKKIRNRQAFNHQPATNLSQTSASKRIQLVTFYPSKMQISSERMIK